MLTATAASGSVFGGWGGACSGTGACTLTLTSDQAVTATFDAVTSMTIGPSGGTVTTPDGVVIDVPQGALAAETLITVARAPNPPSGAVGPVFELGPDGTQFSQPVTLTIPYDPAALGSTSPGDLMIATYGSGGWSGQGWALVDTGSDTVTAFVMHFSRWGVVPSPGGGCTPNFTCFQSCCPAQPPLLCCNPPRSTCWCTTLSTVGEERHFASFVACYAACVGTPMTTNFANSRCLAGCCGGNSGSAVAGACIVPSRDAAAGVLSCSRSCFGTSDDVSICRTTNLALDACVWSVSLSPGVGAECRPGISGVNSQNLYTAGPTVLDQIWGNPPVIEVTSGSITTSRTLSAQLTCAPGAPGTGTGSIEASWSGSRFDGSFSFESSTGSVTVSPGWPP
jgi:hypothetical protein